MGGNRPGRNDRCFNTEATADTLLGSRGRCVCCRVRGGDGASPQITGSKLRWSEVLWSFGSLMRIAVGTHNRYAPPAQVGSRAGAHTVGAGGNPIAFAMDRSPATMVTFPAPATSNAACGFPALRFPVCFLPRVVRPIVPGGNASMGWVVRWVRHIVDTPVSSVHGAAGRGKLGENLGGKLGDRFPGFPQSLLLGSARRSSLLTLCHIWEA